MIKIRGIHISKSRCGAPVGSMVGKDPKLSKLGLSARLCPSTSTHAKVGRRPKLCHPEVCNFIGFAKKPLLKTNSLRPSKMTKNQKSQAPSVAEGPAVRPSPKQIPAHSPVNTCPRAHICPSPNWPKN